MRTCSIVIVVSLVLILSGCGRTVDTSCSAFQPITYSAIGDTAETVTQVRQHNAAWEALCR